MFLSFDRYDRYEGTIVGKSFIDPQCVISVKETHHQPAFGASWLLAEITLMNGDKVLVTDSARTVSNQIAEAQDPKAQLRALETKLDRVITVLRERGEWLDE